MDVQQSELVAQFSGVTGASAETARGALQASDWQLQEAIALYYTSQDEVEAISDTNDSVPQAAATAQPTSSGPSAAKGPYTNKQTKNSSKLRTLKDLQGGSAGNDDDDDDDDDDENKQDFFAGGEKSGLAVQNPNSSKPSDLIKNILNRAKQNAPRPGGEDEDEDDEPQRPSNFTGRAQTLGGDDAPSQVIDASNRDDEDREALPLVQRTLHLWNDGFSVDDGDLYRFDDPANAAAVALIQQGRAPQSILNVQHNQRVDLNLIPHKSDFVQPKKVYKPFGGEGQRLGSPGPGMTSSAPSSTTQIQASNSTPTPQSAPQATAPVDEAQPVITVQFRLGDGSRMTSRFNTTHTIGQLYDFVNTSSPGSSLRAWTLMTTFPSTELADKSATLAETDALKKGGVVMQKWTS